jgi:hypothetical protein
LIRGWAGRLWQVAAAVLTLTILGFYAHRLFMPLPIFAPDEGAYLVRAAGRIVVGRLPGRPAFTLAAALTTSVTAPHRASRFERQAVAADHPAGHPGPWTLRPAMNAPTFPLLHCAAPTTTARNVPAP